MQAIINFITQKKLLSASIAGLVVLLIGVGVWTAFQPSEVARLNSFKDDFSSNTPAKYTRVGGLWKIVNGTAIISEPVLAPKTMIGVANINLFKDSNSGFSDWKLKVEAKVSSKNTGDVAIVFNYKNVNNYYYVGYTSSGGSIRKVVGGKETVLTTFSKSMTLGKSTKLEVRRKNSEYKAYLGSSYVAKVKDTSITGGIVGIGSRASIVEFDNFSFDVKGKPVAPAPVVPAPDDPTPLPSNPTPTPTPPPASTGGVINVKDGNELVKQLLSAKPGTTIQLAANTTYKVAGSSKMNGNSARFIATGAGTEAKPIVITGPSTAIIDGAGTSGNYALYFANASYWVVKGITVANASKGIVMDKSKYITIDDVHVHTIGEEGVHFRDFTTNSVIKNSLVENTGLKKRAYGEGVYIGSAKSNWKGGIPDNSDRNSVVSNVIKNTSAENIDIKEGTSLGVIRGNTFDAAGLSGENYADSMIDVKGNEYIITENKGTRSGTSAMVDGFQVHQVLAGWGSGNDFSSNQLTISSPAIRGYAINVQTKGKDNVVYANNTQVNFTLGLSNIPLSK